MLSSRVVLRIIGRVYGSLIVYKFVTGASRPPSARSARVLWYACMIFEFRFLLSSNRFGYSENDSCSRGVAAVASSEITRLHHDSHQSLLITLVGIYHLVSS